MHSVFRQRPQEVKACERHLFVVGRKCIHTAKELCRVLHLSESGYYRWLRNRDKHSSRQLLAVKVKKILEEHPDNRNYGVDRICLALEQDGVDVMIQSLSGAGHCFDNARMESFFATLKKVKIYQIAVYKLPREQVKTMIFCYVFIYYNRARIYTRNLLGLPPVRYREWAQAQQAA